MGAAGEGPLVADDRQHVARAQRRVVGRSPAYFQFTPLKQACLRACRLPLGFLLTDWRDGLWGAARMGVRHGLYCLGCCWALMALLFVGGAMNLLWIAALTLLVAMEKLAPKGDMLAKALGALMIGAGAVRLIWRAS